MTMEFSPPDDRRQRDDLPFVSVIVPHYDDVQALAKVIHSIGCQSYPTEHFEIIVADNNSKCGIAAVRAAVPDAKVVTAPLQGAGPARNEGARHARGSVLAFIDSDCIADEDWMRNGVKSLAEFDFSGGRVVATSRDPDVANPVEAFEIVFAFDFKRYIEKVGFTGTGNMFVRKVVFDAVGPFRSGLSEDIDWSHRARQDGYRLGYVPTAVVRHPARRSWDALEARWSRMLREQFVLAGETPSGRTKWAIAALLMPLSIVPHAWRVIRSPRLRGARERFGAIAVLGRLRVWRAAKMLRLLTASQRKADAIASRR